MPGSVAFKGRFFLSTLGVGDGGGDGDGGAHGGGLTRGSSKLNMDERGSASRTRLVLS